ncbi:MAG: diphthamide biosynthesis enzyme Dph2 [Promethearchaeati archaeon SRVP18_Atabeyarchaeia-1]
MKSDEIVSSYELNVDGLIKDVESRKSRRIILQFPDGLLEHATKIAEKISEKTGSQTIVSLDTCYGACDLATIAASQLGADLIIHYGHAEWPGSQGVPVIYLEAFASLGIQDLLPAAKDHLSGSKRVGLVSTIQHIHELQVARRYLEDNGFKVLIGKAKGRIINDGQVLGCDYSTAKSISDRVDKFLIIAGGEFHAIGLALATKKESIIIDPYSREVSTTRGLLRRYVKSRYGCIMEARSAQNLGVVIGLKSGQLDLARAIRVRDMLEKSGRKVVLFCADNLDPERLNSIKDIDAFVVTACPRIAVDDASLFRKPVLTTDEAEMMLSEKLLEAYLKPS